MARKKVALDFEQSLADLQTLVERLENGELSLEDSAAQRPHSRPLRHFREIAVVGFGAATQPSASMVLTK